MLERLKRSRVVATAIALQDRYGRDAGGNVAAAIAYFGFLSLFPLVLLALSIVGFVLAGRPGLHDDWVGEIARALPGLDEHVRANLSRVVDLRGTAGVVALAGLLWTGRGVVVAAERGLARMFGGRSSENVFRENARRLGTTVGLGVLALGGTAVTAIAGGVEPRGALGVVASVGGVLVGLAIDVGLFLAAYRLLIVRPGPPWRTLWPGALFAAIGWTALKFAGSWYASRTVTRAASVYGPFAATVGVLVILYLAARLFVYGAELIVVLRDGKDGAEGGGDVERKDDLQPAQQTAPGAERSTVRIVTDVAADVGTLVRKEVELAKQEVAEAVTARVKGIAALAFVGVLALFALGFMAAAGATALEDVLPAWASRLVVAGAFLLFAGVAVTFARTRMKRPPLTPVKTKETIKEDVEWAKAQLRR